MNNLYHVDFTNQTQQIISIGSGMLGLERGLERAGLKFEVAAYVEIEAFIIANLVAAMEKGILDPAPIWADVKTFPYRSFYKKIHGIVAGYPCQPFSNAGKRKGNKDPRHLWPFIYRIVQSVRPFWCFFENVEGHLTLGYDQVSRDLRKIGYRIEEGIFSASEVGAPHQRKRLFILAIMGNTECYGLYRCCEESRRKIGKCEQRRMYKPKRAGKLGYPTKQGLQIPGLSGQRKFQKERRSWFHYRSKLSGIKLANPNQPDRGTNHREFRSTANSIKREAQKQYRQWLCSEPGNGCKDVAYHSCLRSKAGLSGSKQWKERITGKLINGGNQWPARPGQPQYEYEEPRTIKPGLGCSAHGYNFREDLLRMYGNGVVEQTAEKAFITLLEKHIKKQSKSQLNG